MNSPSIRVDVAYFQEPAKMPTVSWTHSEDKTFLMIDDMTIYMTPAQLRHFQTRMADCAWSRIDYDFDREAEKSAAV